VAGDQPRDGAVTRQLTRLVVLLAAVALVGGVFAFREHQSRSSDSRGQDRYGAVQQAASDEVSAFLNFDYHDPQKTMDAVKAGATDDFASQYDKGQAAILKVAVQNRALMTATVLWAGVVDVDPDSATVIVATTGTSTNSATGDEAAARYFRIKVELVNKDGRWLTSALDFVQVAL